MARRPEWWLKKRNKSIGGNRATAIAGVSKFSDARKEAQKFLGQIEEPDISNSPDVRRGLTFEKLARKMLRDEGFVVEPHPQYKFMESKQYPWAHAIPDGWVHEETTSPVQIKVPRPMKCEQIRLNGLSPDYMVQAQHEMAVTGASKLYFAVLNVVTVDLILVPVMLDEAFVENLMHLESDWMQTVQAGQLPEVGEQSGLIEVPTTEGEMQVITSPETIDAAKAYLEAKALMEESEELLESAKSRLFGATCEDVRCFEVRESDAAIARCHRIAVDGARKFDAKACVAENPEMERYYVKGKAYTSERVYDMRRTEGAI